MTRLQCSQYPTIQLQVLKEQVERTRIKRGTSQYNVKGTEG